MVGVSETLPPIQQNDDFMSHYLTRIKEDNTLVFSNVTLDLQIIRLKVPLLLKFSLIVNKGK